MVEGLKVPRESWVRVQRKMIAFAVSFPVCWPSPSWIEFEWQNVETDIAPVLDRGNGFRIAMVHLPIDQKSASKGCLVHPSTFGPAPFSRHSISSTVIYLPTLWILGTSCKQVIIYGWCTTTTSKNHPIRPKPTLRLFRSNCPAPTPTRPTHAMTRRSCFTLAFWALPSLSVPIRGSVRGGKRWTILSLFLWYGVSSTTSFLHHNGRYGK